METATLTTKEQIIELHEAGIQDVNAISKQVKKHPSYVAQILRQAGLLTGYFDLFTNTEEEQGVYSRFFRHVLKYTTVEDATKSIERINDLYRYFEEIGDRAGQHQAMVLALTGKNRARWSGKQEQARIFSDWLASH